MRTKDRWDVFNHSWNALVLSLTEEELNERVNRMHMDFADAPLAVEYCMKQWVLPYSKKFVAYSTNYVKHYGNTTSR